MIRWLRDVWRRWNYERKRDWGRVPPPDWSAKRGSGREYW